jgi:hypothetical protein
VNEAAPEPELNGGARTTNTAESGSTVAIQAESVHNSTVYMVQPDASPQRKYEVGVNYLEGGVPGEARQFIGEAMANGHDTCEVRFHLVLAMLSKRSDGDLTDEDRERVGRMSDPPSGAQVDEWSTALTVIRDLLAYMHAPPADPGPLLDELHSLPAMQRAKILRHLDLMLTGVLKDRLWEEARGAAERGRLDHDRTQRVWAYFQPTPALPRARVSHDDPPTLGEWFRTAVTVAVFAVALGRLAYAVIADWSSLPVLSLLLLVAAGVMGAYAGSVWSYRSARLAEKEWEHAYARSLRPPEPGYARQVEHRLQHYSHIYAPPKPDRERWLIETAGIRSTLRDEVAALYKGVNRITEVDWLTRYLVRDVRKKWMSGTMHEYRKRYRTSPSIKASFLVSAAVLIPTGTTVVVTAARVDPLLSTLATPIALVGGWIAGAAVLKLVNRRRRSTEGRQEHEEALAARKAEYQRWHERLKSVRPSEEEMEHWLDCDRKLFIDAALNTYQLAWRDVITHALLQGPAKSYRRARDSNGQWRYSKYDLRLFLITRHGVREVGAQLNFLKAATNGQERNNFRFDAVSSMGVTIDNEARHILELTLTNGPSRTFTIADSSPKSASKSDESDGSTDLDLDAAGFSHTLHVLEGIAAEGKSWINRHRPRILTP